MAEFKLGRIRFVWKNTWTTGTPYYKDDVIRYGGNTYICAVGHTSAADFNTDLEYNPTKWNLMTEGQAWKSDWAPNTFYKINDIVKYGGQLYICNDSHTSAATAALGLETNTSSWTIFAEGFDWKNNWATSTRYKPNDLVRYGGYTYVCNEGHTSTSTVASGLEVDQSKWDDFNPGLEYKGDWTTGTRYKKNDIVKNGAGLWICTTHHTAAAAFLTDIANWSQFVEGIEYEAVWNSSTVYQPGDVVLHGGHQYIAKSVHSNVSPTAADSSVNWALFSEGFKFEFDWNSGATYEPGHIVRLRGYTYLCTTTNGNVEPPNTSYWQRLNSGISWRGEWTNSTAYKLGDAVRFNTSAYICVQGHTSNDDDSTTTGDQGRSPQSDVTGTYWNLLSSGSETAVLTTRGDMVYYGGAGPTRLPVGIEGQVLRSNGTDPEWVSLGYSDHTYYVAPHGVDAPFPVHGGTLDMPWKSIRYACEQIEKGPRNPNAQYLLEMNRAFIQREVTEWIDRQISTNTAPFTTGFDYDEYKCERDTGYLVDRLIHDLGHGGNLKMRAAAQAYVNALADGPYSTAGEDVTYTKLSTEGTKDVAAFNYMLTLIGNVLSNTAPTVNYQTLNGDNSTATVAQYFNTDLVAEEGVLTTITSLVGIVTTALTDQSSVNIPDRYVPNDLVMVKSGRYRETLPIIVPAECCILGDEVRSVNAGPAGSLVSEYDAKYSLDTLGRLETVVGQIVLGTDVTETSGNTQVQDRHWPYASSVESTSVKQLVRAMKYSIDFQLGTLSTVTYTDPTGYNVGYLTGYGDARKLIKENKKFLQEEIRAYLQTNYPTLKYSQTACLRDVGYIVDALVYDLTYGGNSQSVQAGLAYYEGVGSNLFINSSEKAATLASYARLKTMVQQIAVNTTVSNLQNTIPQFKDTAGSAGSATFLGANLDTMIAIVDGGPSAVYTLSDPATTNGVSSTTALINAYSTLNSAASTIASNTITYINTNYPTLVYNSTKCSRDVGIILKAVGYDFMLNSTFQTTKAAYSYLRASASEVFDLNQKAATRAALEYVRTQAIANVGADATAIARINTSMQIIDDIIFAGSNQGSVCQTSIRAADYARLQLERNRAYIVAEISAYMTQTYKGTVTASNTTTDVFTVGSTSWLQRNTAIKFSGNVFGGITAGTTYYVQNIVSSTTFTVATTRNATTALNLTTVASGSMTVALDFNSDLCLRDVGTMLDALKYDTMWPGNYKSLLAARYYANAVKGSYEEDMYYVRNGTGIRNQTLEGLSGDLTPANAYGTSRVTAGAYVSLDPGWGPDDFRTWIMTRSPYVQNCCTFGNAAIGQKIDGSLHNGGNRSIVSNDFTQIISDGIGAWVTNNGRAELVSVFTYYSHVGYLAEAGGRIRGTNGNNSYGDFGSVAEGYDATETTNTAIVDNKFQYKAMVGHVFTDAINNVWQLEFDNAGTDYTTATWSINGAGQSVATEADEFRDGAVFQVRLLDNVDDSTSAPEADGNYGGFGYISNSNTAQAGTTTQLTIAATDSEISTAYIGMKLYLTGGTGVGQYGIIATYNNGTKIATVTKESTGAAGWDHIVPGTPIVSPDASTTYTIEPRISFAAPSYASTARTLATSMTYVDAKYAPLWKTYLAVSGTPSGTGIGATFDVTRKGTKYSIVTLKAAGTGYKRLDTITILGTNLGGATTTNDLTITVTSINSVNGAITAFDISGYASGGNFVAISAGTRTINTSANGTSWTERLLALPSTSNWTSLAAGPLKASETAGAFVTGRSYTITSLGNTVWTSIGATNALVGETFVATGAGTGTGTATPNANHIVAVSSSTTVNAYSADGGVTWTNGGAMPSSGTWTGIAYGNGRWVAVRSGSTATAYSTDGGASWTDGGALPANTTWTSIAYGAGKFVAIAGTGTDVAYSTDGGLNWVAGTGLGSASWTSITYGKNKFVAVNSSGAAPYYSLNGIAWLAAANTPSGTFTDVGYGQGVFFAVSQSTASASSEDGVNWTARTMSTAANGFSAVTFGNPNQSGIWVAVQRSTASTVASSMTIGATAKARAYVAENKIYAIRMIEPGSGYSVAPTITITDPNNLYEAPTTVRIGNGALANPSFSNRGTGYSAASAEIDTGDGYGDTFQSGQYIAVRRLTQRPVAGSNVVFSHLPDQTFKLVSVLTFLGSYDGSYTAFFQISPDMKAFSSPPHGTTITTRIRYSQVRLTGHDFLDIGTGSFNETNYPTNIPDNTPAQANETVEGNGGRVFFTSTDQDGNFRVGDLFTIEQSTGVATLNADAFNIAGLQELSLGSVSLGGGSATITEFSTDPFFTLNSDNVVPTQRAIKAYISSQIGGGGASLNVNSVTAGNIVIATNVISTTTGSSITMKANFNFRAGVTGYPIAWNYFLN